MKPQPQPELGGVGGATPYPWEALASEWAEKWPLTPDLPAPFSADAAWAVLAFNANQALTFEVAFAHVLAHLANAQSKTLADTSEQMLPEGAVRDALTNAASLQAQFAKQLAEAASRVGRAFGHMAYAFPPVDHGHH
ncbi:MAG: hypothetical protein ABI886_09840 [Betaproteobacteria bacterium]